MRNDTLNIAAYAVGPAIRIGAVSETEATAVLEAAARRVGLPPSEARATIRSGISAGWSNDYTLTERELRFGVKR
jgi:hypothetical protein